MHGSSYLGGLERTRLGRALVRVIGKDVLRPADATIWERKVGDGKSMIYFVRLKLEFFLESPSSRCKSASKVDWGCRQANILHGV